MTHPVARLLHHAHTAYHWLRRPLTMGVRAVVLRDDAVLLVRHTYMPGWYFPGGGIEKGEAVEEALRRELREEVGVTFEGAPALLGVYSNFRQFKSDHIVLFRVERWTMDPRPNAEIAEHRLFPLTATPADTSPGTRRRLEEIRQGLPPSFRW